MADRRALRRHRRRLTGEVARHIENSLWSVQSDDLLPPHTRFEVTADTTGSVDLIRIMLFGVAGIGECADAVHRAFGLANHYNRVNLTRPEQTRFVQCVLAVHDDRRPAVAVVGMMSDTVPDLPCGQAEPQSSAEAIPPASAS